MLRSQLRLAPVNGLFSKEISVIKRTKFLMNRLILCTQIFRMAWICLRCTHTEKVQLLILTNKKEYWTLSQNTQSKAFVFSALIGSVLPGSVSEYIQGSWRLFRIQDLLPMASHLFGSKTQEQLKILIKG